MSFLCKPAGPPDVDFAFHAIQKFIRDLEEETTNPENLFRFPDIANEWARFVVIHSPSKPVLFKNDPPGMLFSDTNSDPLDEEFRKWYTRIPPDQVERMKTPEFQWLLLALFDLKPKWKGRDDGERYFRNGNGETMTVPYFKLFHQEVEFRNGRLSVRVPYTTDRSIPGTYVVFSKPCSRWNPDHKYAKVHLPKLIMSHREDVPNRLEGDVVLQFRYVQDEHETVNRRDVYDGEPDLLHVIFDAPFSIEVFARDVKVYHAIPFEMQKQDESTL